ncbi:hypothetical protein BH11PSE2_BH11PSE2_02750 [soil metagenome]
MRPLSIDLTTRITNRTAVYDIGGELFDLIGEGAKARYWRWFSHHKLDFVGRSVSQRFGKLLHKAVSRDFDWAWTGPWPRTAGARMLFVDPVFCARTPLCRDDVVLCHDLGPIHWSKFYNPRARGSYERAYRAIQVASPNMVFVSEQTRRDFLQLYPGDYASLRVIPLYFKPDFVAPPAGQPRQKQILMVGGVERRKNHKAAIEAFRASQLGSLGYELIIAGPPGNAWDETAALAAETDAVRLLGLVDQASLGALYGTARMLFFPTLYEGFGVPALEAAHMGAMPVVSRTGVPAELVGPDGVHVDPVSIESMASGLREAALIGDGERERRLERIRRHQRRYSVAAFRSAWRETLNMADHTPAYGLALNTR